MYYVECETQTESWSVRPKSDAMLASMLSVMLMWSGGYFCARRKQLEVR